MRILWIPLPSQTIFSRPATPISSKKISDTDGFILWRLEGKRSNFSKDSLFSRQHDVRFREQNGTHIFISILDNAKGRDSRDTTNAFSRGTLIAIDESRMEASVEAHYDHPYHARSPFVARRGNYQLLPNANVFMGWSERAMQSEHTPDGEVIWDAWLQVDWMGSYCNYKFDGFVGRPSEPIAAVSKAYTDAHGMTTTVVQVSWNGATKVSRWNLYKTAPNGVTGRKLVDSIFKTGFETVLECTGYAMQVVVKAVDKAGHAIGSTAVIATLADASIGAEAVAQDEQWLEGFEDARLERIRGGGRAVLLFGAGVICGVMAILLLRVAKPQGIRILSYHGYRYVPVAQ